MSKTHVYANNLEIACKASGGSSPCSFPDPCFSPPAPPAGWPVIPYPNTAYAKHATKTSKTVFICNKPVMLKDKSCFKKSTGNEPATGPKSLVTHTKKGKAFFRSWSMDVKIEGKNVCRHTDLMTHNHNPVMGNTGAWQFLSKDTKQACKDEKEKIDDECEISNRDQKRFVDRQKGRNRRRKNNRGKSNHDLRPKTWKDNHCRNLLVKPRPDLLKKQLKDFEADAKEMYHDLAGEAWDVAKNRAAEQAGDTGERMAVKWVAGLGCTVFTPAGTAACEAAVTVWNVLDGVYSVIAGAVRMSRAAMDVQEMMRILSSIPDQLTEVQEAIGDDKKRKALRKKLINEAAQAASDDPCVKARKCMLVPYKGDTYTTDKHLLTVKTGKHTLKEIPKGKGTNFMTKIGMGTSSGCCPGQTGHHVIPDSWAKKAGCTKYSEGQAPVVCVEGVSQNDGTHGEIHTKLNELLAEAMRDSPSIYNDPNEIMKMAAQSHAETFTHCSQNCIQKQLEEYYQGCKKFNAEPIPMKNNGTSSNEID